MVELTARSGGLGAAALLLAAAGLPALASCQERPGDEARGSDETEEGRIEGSFEEGVHESPHGTRRYRLFVPERAETPAPLLVMLHGCTQDPEDFARGTRMNDAAGARGWLVLYPEQPAEAHPQRCWNWYLEEHQRAGSGEPALLTSLVEEVIAARDVDAGRVYVAGVSAGGAMALVMGAAYPDRIAAVASHSGVPYAAGRGTADALTVMGGGGAGVGELADRLRAALGDAEPPPLLLIHGAVDAAVDASNSERAAAAWWLAGDRGREGGPRPGAVPGGEGGPVDLDQLLPVPGASSTGTSAGGLDWRRRTWHEQGMPALELWRVQGMGHAWAGGDPAGSYTDPDGPDASAIVVDFFARVSGDRRGVDGPPFGQEPPP